MDVSLRPFPPPTSPVRSLLSTEGPRRYFIHQGNEKYFDDSSIIYGKQYTVAPLYPQFYFTQFQLFVSTDVWKFKLKILEINNS